MKKNNLHSAKIIAVNLCRFLLAVVFIFSGFVKAVDPMGLVYKIQDYLEAFGLSETVPIFLVGLMAVALPAVEFVLGVQLLFGIKKTSTSILTLLFMLFMTPLTLYLAIANPVTDCGCFGDAWLLTNWETFGKNIVLLIAAVTVCMYRESVLRFITEKSQWMITLYSLLFILGISIYCLRYLPIIDFRPFKIGTNIPQAMSIPPDAKRSVFENVFILEKDGKREEFTLDNYPDSTWTFIAPRPVLRQKGYEPKIADFSILDLETGDDITHQILNHPGYTFLLVANHLDDANDSNIDLINEIYEYSIAHGYGFYGLTASPDYQIEQWADRTGAEYPFYIVDDITLKTMIRANPGLILLKDGTILNKWSDKDLPDEYVLTDALDNIPLGQEKDIIDLRTVGNMFLLLFAPFLLLALVDVFIINKNPLNKKKMRKNIVAGNWKMNKTLGEGIELAKELKEILEGQNTNCDVVICTPFIHLAAVSTILTNTKIGVGAENCADKAQGAYTGEVSAAMVASTGARYVILGHSERRAYYHETAETLKEKVKLALAEGLTPIFCIGEVLAEREAGKQDEVVAAQLAGSLFDLSSAEFGKIVLAYEPVWAIGTGKTATSQQAQEMHAFIRNEITKKYGKSVAENTSILYGGSCNPSNAKELFANPDVDGGLIGGASLKAHDFKGVIDGFQA